MKRIGVIGLGLIGGSMCKAIKALTCHRVYGYDIREDVISSALRDKAIDEALTDETLIECEILLVALYPGDVIDYVTKKAGLMKSGVIIIDMAGVKTRVCGELTDFCRDRGLCFIGGHPMAGIERGGYISSFPGLFQGATMLLCKNEDDQIPLEKATELFLSIGFKEVKTTNAAEHDRIIAYTSQLAHVVSNAYVKSPTLTRRKGFSAGSYKDLTRVARLDPGMWAKLFLENRENLISEIDCLVKHLNEYKQAIEDGDMERLYDLLAIGSRLKIADEEGYVLGGS